MKRKSDDKKDTKKDEPVVVKIDIDNIGHNGNRISLLQW